MVGLDKMELWVLFPVEKVEVPFGEVEVPLVLIIMILLQDNMVLVAEAE